MFYLFYDEFLAKFDSVIDDKYINENYTKGKEKIKYHWKDLPEDWQLDVQNAYTQKSERDTLLDVLRKVSQTKQDIKTLYGPTYDDLP